MTLDLIERLAEKEVEIDHLEKHEQELAEKDIQLAEKNIQLAEKDIQLAEKDAKITALEDENSRLKGMPQKKAHTDQGKNTLQKPDKQAEDNPPTSPQIKSLENKMSQLKKELDKEKNKNKQVSNAHTPPSQDSKAQNDLKKYR